MKHYPEANRRAPLDVLNQLKLQEIAPLNRSRYSIDTERFEIKLKNHRKFIFTSVKGFKLLIEKLSNLVIILELRPGVRPVVFVEQSRENPGSSHSMEPQTPPPNFETTSSAQNPGPSSNPVTSYRIDDLLCEKKENTAPLPSIGSFFTTFKSNFLNFKKFLFLI